MPGSQFLLAFFVYYSWHQISSFILGNLKDFTNFTYLKRKLYILAFFIGITFSSFAQSIDTPEQEINSAKQVKFYPNPAASSINFDFNRGYDKSYSFQVYNFMGKKVYELKEIPSRLNISLEDFYRGVYIFQLRDKNGGIIESGKFQVVK